jgi:hypothetical protein
MDEEIHDEHVHNRKNNMRYMKMKPNNIEIHINRDCDVKVHDDLDKEDGIWGNRDNKPDIHGGGDDDLLRSLGEREREREEATMTSVDGGETMRLRVVFFLSQSNPMLFWALI